MRSFTTAAWRRTSCTTCALNCAYFSSDSLPTGPEVMSGVRAASGEVVVDGDEMSAPARQRVQIQRERGDQRLPLAGRHLRDLALVQDNAADELDIVWHHVPLESMARHHDLAP